MTNDVLARLRHIGVVPLIVLDDPGRAVPLGRALAAGGLPCAEIALRTAGSLEALERMAAELPDVLVGAGTVRRTAQVDQAHAAGARFIVSPGLDEHVVRRSQELGLPVIPGVCTPTEIMAALALDLTVLKFFPAEPMGGLPLLRALAAPFADVEFLPTGGIGVSTLPAYLAFDRVMACGGSWMAPSDWIAADAYEQVREESARAAAIARLARDQVFLTH